MIDLNIENYFISLDVYIFNISEKEIETKAEMYEKNQ